MAAALNPNHLIRYLEEQTRLLKRLGSPATAKPSRQSVHKLRIAARRARAALWILERGSVRIRAKKLSQRLHALGRALGKVRELDVAIEDAKTYGLDPSGLKVLRKTERRRLQKTLRRARFKRLSREIAAVAVKTKSRTGLGFEDAAGALLDRLHRWHRMTSKKDAELHRIRIAMKKIRYCLEATRRPVSPLQKLQEAIGKAHDLEVLEALCGKTPAASRDRAKFERKAKRLIRPALCFALEQLGKKKTAGRPDASVKRSRSRRDPARPGRRRRARR